MALDGLAQEHIDGFFSAEGPLARAVNQYEARKEQVEVANHVAASIRDAQSLVAEAGTGTGKTLAYLVPALASGLRVVLSTGTRNLQEQIINQELPLLESAVGRQFDVQVMKGRSNYLCHHRADRVSRQGVLPNTTQGRLFARVMAWRHETQSGDRAELADLPDDNPLWPEVSATGEQCLGRTCDDFERCWVTQMRRQAQTAQLIIVNHHLYFADAGLKANAGSSSVELIPPHDLVIFDEAHDVDEVASQHFGFEVSDARLFQLLRDIGQATIEDRDLHARLSPIITQAELRTRQLFDGLPIARGRKGRTPLPSEAVGPELHHRWENLDQGLCLLEAALADTKREDLTQLSRRVASFIVELAFVLHQPQRAGILGEVESQLDHARMLTEEDDLYYAEPDEVARPLVPFVRYVEFSARTRKILARPLEVAPLMRWVLATRPALYVSATLAVDKSFTAYRRRIGLDEGNEVMVESPFNYAEQTRLYLPNDLPEPNSPDFVEAAIDRASDLISASGGGAFVLCTSYHMLQAMKRELQPMTGLRILTQGDAPRSQLLRTFREDGHAVLVATLSFWQGVDVPGSALRLVVIDKIPFASPGDPLVEARIELIRSRGGSPFSQYQLPHAAILLRQGFGRLIRRKTDTGMVSILDPRMTRKGYGRVLLRSLPETPIIQNLQEAIEYLDTHEGPS